MAPEAQQKNITLVEIDRGTFGWTRTMWRVIDDGTVYWVNHTVDQWGQDQGWSVQTLAGRIVKVTTKKAQRLVNMVQRDARKTPVEVVR